jgi:hypothetical protein
MEKNSTVKGEIYQKEASACRWKGKSKRKIYDVSVICMFLGKVPPRQSSRGTVFLL